MEISSLITYIKARLMQVKAASWLRLKIPIQAYLRDTAGLVPDHHNKLNYRLSHQEPHVYTVLRLNFTFLL